MDKEILNQYASAKKELAELEDSIAKLSAKLRKLEAQEVFDSVSCGRRGKKPLRTVKIHGQPVKDISRQKRQLNRRKSANKALRDKVAAMTASVEEYINSVPDSETRRLLRFRYLQDMNWKETARMMGKGYTADACKKKVYRFLDVK